MVRWWVLVHSGLTFKARAKGDLLDRLLCYEEVGICPGPGALPLVYKREADTNFLSFSQEIYIKICSFFSID
jgi:hypothetical protein